MASLEALDSEIKSVIGRNKLSSSAVESIVALALDNVASDTALITLLYRHHKKSSPAHKLTSLYLIDAIARAAKSKSKRDGKAASTTPRDNPATSGTCASFLKKLEGLLSKLVLDVWENAPSEHREKVRKVLDIWTKAGTFSSSTLARLGNKLLATAPAAAAAPFETSPIAPPMSPTGPSASPGPRSVPPPADAQPPIPANVLALLQATAQAEPSAAAREQQKKEEEEAMIQRVLLEAQGGPKAFPVPESSAAAAAAPHAAQPYPSTSSYSTEEQSFPRPGAHPSSSSYCSTSAPYGQEHSTSSSQYEHRPIESGGNHNYGYGRERGRNDDTARPDYSCAPPDGGPYRERWNAGGGNEPSWDRGRSDSPYNHGSSRPGGAAPAQAQPPRESHLDSGGRAPLPERRPSLPRSPSVEPSRAATTMLVPGTRPLDTDDRSNSVEPPSKRAFVPTVADPQPPPPPPPSFNPTTFVATNAESWAAFVAVLRESHPWFVAQKLQGGQPSMQDVASLCVPSAVAMFGWGPMTAAMMGAGGGGGGAAEAQAAAGGGIVQQQPQQQAFGSFGASAPGQGGSQSFNGSFSADQGNSAPFDQYYG
ncbi:hypothetical protein JCM11491_003254 [Sporobolomyces phaffii]